MSSQVRRPVRNSLRHGSLCRTNFIPVDPPPPAVNLTTPTLTSNSDVSYPIAGDVLQCDRGSWGGPVDSYTFLWQQSAGVTVQGPTTYPANSAPDFETYTVTFGDLSYELFCTVTATNPGGVISADSNHSGGVTPPNPFNISSPILSDYAPYVGEVLTVDPGQWVHNPNGFSYLWSTGATGSTYTVQPSDLGTSISVTLTGTGPSGSGTATSSSTNAVLPAPPTNTAAPALVSDYNLGDPHVGEILSCTLGAWIGQIDTFTRTWLREDGTIIQERSYSPDFTPPLETYILSTSDIGHAIHCLVSAANAGGSNTADTGNTGYVNIPSPPANLTVPTLSNQAPRIGDTITCTNGTWSSAPTSFGYQWYNINMGSPAPLSGATASSYTVQSSDVGNTLFVQVTASNSGGAGSPANSSPTDPIPSPPILSSGPNFSSNADISNPNIGDVLTADTGYWDSGVTALTLTWRWDNDTIIAGPATYSSPTTESYTIQPQDSGRTIHIQVTATNAAGTTTITSPTTGLINF